MIIKEMGNSTLDEPIQKFSLSRCLRCAKLHRKCDRLLPRCKHCIKVQAECVYKTITRYEQRNYQIEEQLKVKEKAKFDDETISMNKSRQIKNLTLQRLQHHLNRKLLRTTINRLDKISSVDLFESMMVYLQFPPTGMPTIHSNYGVEFEKKLQYLVTRQVKIKPRKMISFQFTQDLKLVIENAKHSFFSFNNRRMPFFLQNNFKWENRPYLLKIAIISCGLLWMKESSIHLSLFQTLTQILESYFAKFSKIKPTFINLQILLILISGLPSLPWIRVQLSNYLSLCERFSLLLGLYLKNYKMYNIEMIERALAYNGLKFIIIIFGYVMIPYSSRPFKPKVLIIHQTKLEHILTYKSPWVQLKNEEFIDNINLLISSFLLVTAKLVFSFCLLRKLNFDSRYDYSQLKRINKSLLKELEVEGSRYKYIVGLLKKHYHSENSKDILTEIENYLQFSIHYGRHMLLTLKTAPYVQNGSSISLIEQNNIINGILKECEQAIQYIIKLNIRFMIFNSIPCVTRCIIFIIKYGLKHKNLMSTAKTGINFIYSISKVPCLAHISKFNLGLIYILCKALRVEI